jgi:hypothetical protein
MLCIDANGCKPWTPPAAPLIAAANPFSQTSNRFYRRMHDVNPLAHSRNAALDFHVLQPIKLPASRDCNHGCS